MLLPIQSACDMPVAYRYGLEALPHDISRKELLFFFSLTEDQRDYIHRHCRSLQYSVVLAVQLGALRFIGRPEYAPEDAPLSILRFIILNLQLSEESLPLSYSVRLATRRQHIQLAREFLGLSSFASNQHAPLIDFLIKISPDPGCIPDWLKQAEDYLRRNRFVLPPVKVLRRIVLSARQAALESAYEKVGKQLGSPEEKLEDLLAPNETGKTPWFELTNMNILNASPGKVSTTLAKIKRIRSFDLHRIDLSEIPKQLLDYLAHKGMHLSAKQLKRHTKPVAQIMIVLAMRRLEAELVDIVIQMNDEILGDIFSRAKSRSKDYLRKHRQSIARIVSAFRVISDTLLTEDLQAEEKIQQIEAKVPCEKMKELREQTDLFEVPRGTEDLFFAVQGYQTIHKYLPQFLETMVITSPSKDDPLIEAVEYLRERQKEGKRGISRDAPTDFIQEEKWKKLIFDPNGHPKTKAWVVCLSDKLRKSFRRGALTIQGTRQYQFFDRDLIPWSEWHQMPKDKWAEFPIMKSPEELFTPLFQAIQDRSKEIGKDRQAFVDEKNRLHLSRLEKVEVPPSAIELQKLIKNHMPPKLLSEVLAEVDRLTAFSSYLTRLSSGDPINPGETPFGRALYAALLSGACNIPLTKLVSPGLTIDLLETAKEEIVRPQTLQTAMIALVNFYSQLPLAQCWGEGSTSSSDGQGFLAEGRPVGARYNRHRFPGARGFILYTHVADNYAPFYVQVIPANVREASFVLDGLLYHGTILVPREHYTDSHGFTDVVFAFLWLLGFKLAPRIANLPNSTLWYGKGFDPDQREIFKGSISMKHILSQWEPIQRIIGTILDGRIPASQLIQKISAFSRKHSLYKAFRQICYRTVFS